MTYGWQLYYCASWHLLHVGNKANCIIHEPRNAVEIKSAEDKS